METNISCFSEQICVAVDHVATKQCEQLPSSKRHWRHDDTGGVVNVWHKCPGHRLQVWIETSDVVPIIPSYFGIEN